MNLLGKWNANSFYANDRRSRGRGRSGLRTRGSLPVRERGAVARKEDCVSGIAFRESYLPRYVKGMPILFSIRSIVHSRKYSKKNVARLKARKFIASTVVAVTWLYVLRTIRVAEMQPEAVKMAINRAKWKSHFAASAVIRRAHVTHFFFVSHVPSRIPNSGESVQYSRCRAVWKRNARAANRKLRDPVLPTPLFPAGGPGFHNALTLFRVREIVGCGVPSRERLARARE